MSKCVTCGVLWLLLTSVICRLLEMYTIPKLYPRPEEADYPWELFM